MSFYTYSHQLYNGNHETLGRRKEEMKKDVFDQVVSCCFSIPPAQQHPQPTTPNMPTAAVVCHPFFPCLVPCLPGPGSYVIPSGKLSHNYGKSPFSMGKSTINGDFQ